MERPILTRFFENKGLKEVHESYLKAPELYAYALSMENYADWLEEKYNEACEGKKQPDTESKCNKHIVKASFSNKYGFLYWCENDTTADDGRCKWIEASTLDEACAKFIKKAPKTLRQVDYEVQLGNKYIDISERADFKNWL